MTAPTDPAADPVPPGEGRESKKKRRRVVFTFDERTHVPREKLYAQLESYRESRKGPGGLDADGLRQLEALEAWAEAQAVLDRISGQGSEAERA